MSVKNEVIHNDSSICLNDGTFRYICYVLCRGKRPSTVIISNLIVYRIREYSQSLYVSLSHTEHRKIHINEKLAKRFYSP